MSKVEKKPQNKEAADIRDKIILGLDPGTNIMGYGIVSIGGKRMTLLQYGVIRLGKTGTHEGKLKKIFDKVLDLVDEFLPDEVALEAPFYGKNVQSMLKLGRAQGVAMSAALSREIPITEYAPRKIKHAVTGNGNASKEQVSRTLMQIFSLRQAPKFLDASDALAVAVCHYYQAPVPQAKKQSWESFINENPKRVRK